MAKTPQKQVEPGKVDLEPDAWERFEHAIDTVTKSPPKPKPKRVDVEETPKK